MKRHPAEEGLGQIPSAQAVGPRARSGVGGRSFSPRGRVDGAGRGGGEACCVRVWEAVDAGSWELRITYSSTSAAHSRSYRNWCTALRCQTATRLCLTAGQCGLPQPTIRTFRKSALGLSLHLVACLWHVRRAPWMLRGSECVLVGLSVVRAFRKRTSRLSLVCRLRQTPSWPSKIGAQGAFTPAHATLAPART